MVFLYQNVCALYTVFLGKSVKHELTQKAPCHINQCVYPSFLTPTVHLSNSTMSRVFHACHVTRVFHAEILFLSACAYTNLRACHKRKSDMAALVGCGYGFLSRSPRHLGFR